VAAFDRATPPNADTTPADFVWVVDTTPPSITVPASQVLEAASGAGAIATFGTATATDGHDGTDPVSCTGAASGATFPLGVTTVGCSSADQAGNAASASFTITVRDTTPSAIDAHVDITVAATSATGAVVVYTAPATHDAVDGTGVATCAPASGLLFPVGQTTVTCHASDAAHNAALPTTFKVTVQAFTTEIGHFVAFSSDLTWIRANADVTSGDVGANDRRHQDHHGDRDSDDGDRDDVTVRIGSGASLDQHSSRVVGDTVRLDNKSSVYNVLDNFLLNKKGSAVLGTRTTPVTIPFTTLPAFPSVTPGSRAVTVAKKQTLTLAAGSYGTVHVSSGATLILTGGLYQMLSLDVDQQGTVLFHAAVDLRIKTELDTASKSNLLLDPAVSGLRASQAVIYVEGQDSDCHHNDADDDGDNAGPTSAHVGSQSIVQANIYAKNGTVWLKSKTTATGAFIGMHVRIGVSTTLALDSAF
jgi:hypothetical protein